MVVVKICGLTRPEDVRAACALGADIVGVILVPQSRRYVTVDRAKQLFNAAGRNVARAAVLMPRGPDDVAEVAEKLKPDYLQIHLTFPPYRLRSLKGELGAKVIGVVPVPTRIERHDELLERAIEVSEASDFVLIDTKGPTGGGTGLTHDWAMSAEIRYAVDKPVFLAGGLGPANVARAIGIVKPHGVDVATGVEASPGIKDAGLIREFIDNARQA